jgi:hypothetical protein
MRPDRVQLGLERPLRAEHRLDRERSGHVGHREQVRRVVDRQQQHAEHAVGAVDERQPFLGRQRDRLQPRPAQRLAAVDAGAGLVAHPALAEQHERAVGQRGQVAGGAEGAVLRHPRRDVGVQQVHEGRRDQRTDAAVAQRERAHPQEHHRADDLARHRRAHPGRVRADQRVLELGTPGRCDERVGERPETGRDAVHGPAGLLDPLDDVPRADHGIHSGFGERDPGVAAGDGGDVGGRDAGGLDDDGIHAGTPLCRTLLTRGTPGR